MNKRERKSSLKDIVKMIDENLVYIEGNATGIIGQAQQKIEDLALFLEENCIMPENFDAEEMKKEILVDYFDNDEDIQEILGSIESFREEVYEHIGEMREGANKEEWEEFYANLEYIEDIVNIEEQEISDIETYIENMEQLKRDLEDLI